MIHNRIDAWKTDITLLTLWTTSKRLIKSWLLIGQKSFCIVLLNQRTARPKHHLVYSYTKNNNNDSLLAMFVGLVRNDFNSYGQLQDEKDRQIGSTYARRPVMMNRSKVSTLWFVSENIPVHANTSSCNAQSFIPKSDRNFNIRQLWALSFKSRLTLIRD